MIFYKRDPEGITYIQVIANGKSMNKQRFSIDKQTFINCIDRDIFAFI